MLKTFCEAQHSNVHMESQSLALLAYAMVKISLHFVRTFQSKKKKKKSSLWQHTKIGTIQRQEWP